MLNPKRAFVLVEKIPDINEYKVSNNVIPSKHYHLLMDRSHFSNKSRSEREKYLSKDSSLRKACVVLKKLPDTYSLPITQPNSSLSDDDVTSHGTYYIIMVLANTFYK